MQDPKSLKQMWLNGMLRFSAWISDYKNRLTQTNGPKIIFYGFIVLILEIGNLIFSLPAYALITPQSFGGNENQIKSYRLRRIVSLSVIGGFLLTLIIWITFGILGLTLFPSKSQASTAAWDFNLPLAYHYDSAKIQIIDGAVIFKANQVIFPSTPTVEPIPVITPEPTPIPTPEPVVTPPVVPPPAPEPTPVVAPPAPTPSIPTGPVLFNTIQSSFLAFFETKIAFAQPSNSCSATLEPIAPLVVTPFYGWTSFSEIATKDSGEIYYNLSQDGGLTWLFWNGASWTQSSGSEANPDWNTATEVNSHISDLTNPNSQGSATLSFKAKFVSDCNHDITLHSLDVDYDDTETILSGIVGVGGDVATSTITTTEENIAVLEVSDSIASTTLENSLTSSIEVNTNVATTINFSIHVVIQTTGQSGNVLYSIPGLFTLEETDNGLEAKVIGTDSVQHTLSSNTNSSANTNVSIGDHIIVLTYDGSTLKFYIDGSLSSSVSVPIVIAPPLNVSTEIGCTSLGVILEALSLAQINANYMQCGNRSPQISFYSVAQNPNSKYVYIDYVLTDPDDTFASLSQYEFSTTGAFTGEERTMTPAVLDINHSGTSGLITNQTENYTDFAWDTMADLPDVYDNSVYVRLKATDGLAESLTATFGPIAIDTISPMNINIFSGISSNDTQILWYWNQSSDQNIGENFDHYEIIYGTNSDLLQNVWGVSRDTDLRLAATDRTVIAGLTPDTLYYAKIKAFDDFGHISISELASFRTQPIVQSSTTTESNPVVIDGNTLISISGDVVVGETLPDTSTLPPTTPQGGFRVKINQDKTSTNSENVNLFLYAGSDTTLMLVSNYPDFRYSSAPEEFSPTKSWSLCDRDYGQPCESGTHTIYVKYYTAFGIGSVAVADNITLNLPDTTSEVSVGANTSENSSGGGFSDTGRRNQDSQNSGDSNNSSNGNSNQNKIGTVAPFSQGLLNDLSATKESGIVKKPEISNVSKSITENSITFKGTGIPKSKVALFIHSDQVVVYTTEVDQSGKWSFSHNQKNIELAPGEHQVFAVTYDPWSKIKSKPSLIQTFEVKQNIATVFLSYFDIWTTILTLLIILLIVGYMFSKKERNKEI